MAAAATRTVLDEAGELIASDPQAAAVKLRDLLEAEPLNAAAYRLLGRALADGPADSAGGVRTVIGGMDYNLLRASKALSADDLETAEIILRNRLRDQPLDHNALFLMARLALALGFEAEADDLLELVIELRPEFVPAYIERSAALQKRNQPLEAAAALEPVLAHDPGNAVAKALKAAALGRAGQFDESLRLYRELLEAKPKDPSLWTSYGHVLKTMGRSEDGVEAMRKAVVFGPTNGEAWWNLSNLKTFEFSDEDVATMTAALAGDVSNEDRFHVHFALGKAFEDRGEAAAAFEHYSKGNALRRRDLVHDPRDIAAEVTGSVRTYTPELFDRLAGAGTPDADPIFVVGMPRAGSTLVEQILASHSAIEGTMELPDIALIARGLGRGEPGYFHRLASVNAEELHEFGLQYLRSTRAHRVEGRPRFVDKMPNNWLFVPLIHLVLPNAKIIDIRRHPLANGWSNFKQHFARGQAFSYDLEWFGRYYADYVRMMAHVDEVLPGRVHRVMYEELVKHPESEIPRLFDYLELPFEPACLEFHRTERAVRTPSSEQVRRPMDPALLVSWKPFEPWLDPLRAALGDVVDDGSAPRAPVVVRPGAN
jgi:tetratricopeptide (TPR) repeat protein